MKRFHVHMHVVDLTQSVGFYSKLFAAEPTRLESDYAKWMLEDARSEKHWVTDPQGIAWEHFHTLGNIPVFSESNTATTADAAVTRGKPVGIAVKSAGSCC